MKFYRGEILSSHPKFPKGSAAETQSSAMPVDITAPDLVYTKEDDEAIDLFMREIGELVFAMSVDSSCIYGFTFFSWNFVAFGTFVGISTFSIGVPFPRSVALVP